MRINKLFCLIALLGVVYEAQAYPTVEKQEKIKKLTPIQYQVTQEAGTEPAF